MTKTKKTQKYQRILILVAFLILSTAFVTSQTDGIKLYDNATFNANDNNITNFFNQTQCGSGKVVQRIYRDGSYECVDVESAAGTENLSETLKEGASAGPYSIDMNDNSVNNIFSLSGSGGKIRMDSNLDMGNNKIIFGGSNISGGLNVEADLLMNDNDIRGIKKLNPEGKSTNFGGDLNVGLNDIVSIDKAEFSRGIEIGNSETFTGQKSEVDPSNFTVESDSEWTNDKNSSSNTTITTGDLELGFKTNDANVVWNKSVPSYANDVAVEGGTVYVLAQGDLVKYDEDGNQIWSTGLGGSAEAIRAKGDDIYVGDGSRFAKYKDEGGSVSEVWDKSTDGDVKNIGYEGDEFFLALSSSNGFSKYVDNGTSASKSWFKGLSNAAYSISASGDKIYIGTNKNALYRYPDGSSAPSSKTWEISLPGNPNAVEYSGGEVYVGMGYSSNRLKKYNDTGSTANEIWSINPPGKVDDLRVRDNEVFASGAAPVLSGGSPYIGKWRDDGSSYTKFWTKDPGTYPYGIDYYNDFVYTNIGSENRILKYETLKKFYKNGRYESDVFNALAATDFPSFEVDSYLPAGLNTTVKVRLSNSSSFGSYEQKKLELGGGIESQPIGVKAQYAKFIAELRGDSLDTPEVGRVTINYGNSASAFGYDQIAIGSYASTSKEGAVAIGYNATSNERYKAVLGNNYSGQRLDVDVTGNLTVQGGELDMKNGKINNFFNQSECGSSEAIKTIYDNGTFECNSISTTTETENLSETLEAGNVANQTIELDNNSLREVSNIDFTAGAAQRQAPQYPYSFGVSTARYKGNSEDLVLSSGTADSLAFSNDGRKMFVIDSADFDVDEYSLTSAYNVSSADFVDSFDISSQTGNNPSSLEFSNDGRKMFIAKDGSVSSNYILEYSLSSPFDISSADYNGDSERLDVDSEDANPNGLDFSNDGHKMFMFGGQFESVFEYSLSSAFDVSSADFVDSIDISSQASGGDNLEFSNDGRKMFVSEDGSDAIVNEFGLSSAFDVSSASFEDSFDASSQASFLTGFEFSDNGQEMFLVDTNNDRVYEYSLGLDVNSGNLDINGNKITGFFDSACSSGKVVEQVYPNGSYSCVDPVEDTGVEGLSETLAENNTANQSIDLADNDLQNVSVVNPENEDLRVNASSINFSENNISDISHINNYFDDDLCPTNEAVKRVYSNGSYECVEVLPSFAEIAQGIDFDSTIIDWEIEQDGSTFSSDNGHLTFRMGRDFDGNFSARSVYSGGFTDTAEIRIWNTTETTNGDGDTIYENDAVLYEIQEESGDNWANFTDIELNESEVYRIELNNSEYSLVGNYPKGPYTEVIASADKMSSYEYGTFGNGDLVWGFSAFAFDAKTPFVKREGDEMFGDLSMGENDLEFDNGVRIGEKTKTNEFEDIAVGYNSSANATDAGSRSALALGGNSLANGWNSLAIGPGARATERGSVAIGPGAVSNSEGLVVFDSDGESVVPGTLSVKMTGSLETGQGATIGGNTKINGDRLNMTGGSISNFFNQTQCSSGKVVEQIYPNGSYSCVDPVEDQGVENLSETLEEGNVANQTILSPDGVAIGGDADGTGSASVDGRQQVAIGTFADTDSNKNTVSLGYSASNSGTDSVALGSFTDADGSGVAIGGDAQAKSGSVSIGFYANDETSYTTGSDAIAIGNNANSIADGSVAIGHDASAPNSYEATFGNLNGEELDVNVTGNLTVHQSAALGSNTLDNLSDGDINASNIYYDTLTAKSPVVQCSQGSKWCEVSEPEKQSHYFVKKSDDFDKDRPRETALEVVESDVETVEKFEELRRENRENEERIDELESEVSDLKSLLCEDNPGAEVCN